MTYVVTDACIKCKYTDCVEVCPVDCFYEGENMLVINPSECIDCGVCEPECPAEAILPDTEDGLEKLLRSVRPHTMGKVVIVFGCGGDRDPDKRPKMGAVAAKLADDVIVTDDNPRTENAEMIRAAVMAGCPDAQNIGDREAAIRAGIERLGPQDCLVIAGKGHEQGQIVGAKVIPFSDVEQVRLALEELGHV